MFVVILSLLGLLAGIGILLKSTDVFLDEAVDLFSYWRFSPFVIGVLVVGFGTSMPELGVAISSALSGDSALALGTALGSNIANIALILGVSALITSSMKNLGSHIVTGFLLFISLLLTFFISDFELHRFEAVILLVLFVGFLVMELLKGKETQSEATQSRTTFTQSPKLKDMIRLIGSLLFVLISSRMIVVAAEKLASYADISESFIGLSIIALGSSMPELVTSVVAIKKGQMSLVYGNVIGSNIMNTLLVVGAAVVISPIMDIEKKFLTGEMVIVSMLSCFLLIGGLVKLWEVRVVQKVLGVLFILGYLAYLSHAVMRII